VDKWGAVGGSDGGDPFEEDISGAVLDPEPGGSILSNSHDVLDVEVGFSTSVGVNYARRAVGSDDFGDWVLGKAELLLELGQVGGRVALARLEEGLSDLRRLDVVVLDVVIRIDERGVNRSVRLGHSGRMSGKHRLRSFGNGERDNVSDDLEVIPEDGGDGVFEGADDGLLGHGGLEAQEFGSEHLVRLSDGGIDNDELTVGGDLVHVDSVVLEEDFDGIEGLLVLHENTDLFEGQVTSILRRRDIGDFV